MAPGLTVGEAAFHNPGMSSIPARLLPMAGGLLLAALPALFAGEPAPPWRHGGLKVSENGRYLQTGGGAPFFWMGDTAWRLFQRLSREEAVAYLEDRRRKGYNVIQVMIASSAGEKNHYGHEAFTGGDPGRPRTTEEDDYWDHIDYILGQAEARGMYLAMLPAWCSLAKAGLNESNAPAYIGFLVGRYRHRPNVIWVNGGDCRGSDFAGLWRLAGGALKSGDPQRLVTFHPFGGTSSSMWFHDEEWLDFNMFQSGHRRYDQVREEQKTFWKGEDGWRFVEEDLAKRPPKPTIDAEPSYESIPQGLHDPKEPYWDADHIRRYAYWAVFAGAFGHTYGHNAVMQMYKPGAGKGAYGVRETWSEALDAPGARQAPYLKKLILSRPALERVPDQDLIAGANGERYERIIATRGESYAFLYTFSGRPFEVRMGRISGGKVTAWWFDPRTGQARRQGEFANKGVRTFEPPGTPGEGNDWVLVLDDAARKFSAPGAQR